MGTELTLISGTEPEEKKCDQVSPEVMLRHFRNITRSMMDDALGVWSEILRLWTRNVSALKAQLEGGKVYAFC